MFWLACMRVATGGVKQPYLSAGRAKDSSKDPQLFAGDRSAGNSINVVWPFRRDSLRWTRSLHHGNALPGNRKT
jgi:hypothetical protein